MLFKFERYEPNNDIEAVLNGPLTPPISNFSNHKQCIAKGMTNCDVYNCFEVCTWNLPDRVVEKRAADEAYANEDVPFPE